MAKVQKLHQDIDVVAEIQLHLEAYKLRIATEIRQYPMPIPGCDAQYNFLLDQRAGVNQELKQLEALSKRTLTAHERTESVCDFINASEHIQSGKSRELLALIAM